MTEIKYKNNRICPKISLSEGNKKKDIDTILDYMALSRYSKEEISARYQPIKTKSDNPEDWS